VDRGRRSVATFFSATTPVASSALVLGAEAAQHARVRRLERGAAIRLVDGRGTFALGELESLARAEMVVTVHDTRWTPQPPPLELVLPVADKERMLWAVEKATEFGATAIRPVMFARSRSVAGRGEGATFATKLEARMHSALEQSGGAWLPRLHPQCEPDGMEGLEPMRRLLLDAGAAPIPTGSALAAAVVFLVGPEGGLEAAERARLVEVGWEPVSIASNTLRFETAGIAAMAMAAATRLREIPSGHD
jgi:16S rRNA (uracil1498-N3)-methyltransferase